MKKPFLLAIVVIAGMVIGSVAGGYLVYRRYARDYAIVRAYAWIGIFSGVAVGQYDRNTNDAKGELRYLLDFYSQGISSSVVGRTMKNAFLMNRGLTEARLSVLESEAGNVDLAKSFMSRAQEDLKTVGWIDHSEANILQTVKRQPDSPCGANPQNAAKTSPSVPQKPCG